MTSKERAPNFSQDWIEGHGPSIIDIDEFDNALAAEFDAHALEFGERVKEAFKQAIRSSRENCMCYEKNVAAIDALYLKKLMEVEG